MKRNLFFLLLAIFLFSCSDTEFVEEKEDGVVVEAYTRRKSDFAKQGTYFRYSKEGVLLEKSEYKNNQLDGKQEFFYPNGQVQEMVHYKNGVHNGEYKSFFEDGQIAQESQYVDGALNGTFKDYYPSGQLKEVLIYKNNEEVGPFKEYHKNGKLKAEGTYGGSDPDTGIALENGELKKYDENGIHYQTMNCINGLCRTTWKLEGAELKEE
ncbi:MAG TPA: toxin-antitoxin system YwqK family antitoxin [Phaeodactylibacter sp.]|nr:toxin-antitoxin system YwqK family antitoxin [Phaeodactylibacter sp.]